MIRQVKKILSSQECEYFSIAFFYHCCIIGLLAFCFVAIEKNEPIINIIIQTEEKDEVVSVEVPPIEDFNISEKTSFDQLNQNSSDSSLKTDTNIDIPSIFQLEASDSKIDSSDKIPDDLLSGVGDNIGNGTVSEKTTGGALDRLTLEIAKNSDHNNLHVVWLLDASISLSNQRKDIGNRFNKILSEVESIRNPSNIIVHSICSYGAKYTKLCEQTDNPNILLSSINSVPLDLDGVENTFQTVHDIAQQYGKKDPRLMIIIFTDEKGDDIDWLNAASMVCRKKATPVYVVGVPAPFGKDKAQFKYVDPDPEYDQKERWVEIQQGPETLYPMVLNLRSLPVDDEVLDSGFGPFGLCSICSETGGIYFSIHPDRDKYNLTRDKISPLSSNISRFFDRDIMYRFSPDYRSPTKQTQEINTHRIKKSLINACTIPLYIKDEQTLNFTAFNEGDFVNQLNQAQRFAAKIEPQINQVYMILQENEKDFDTLTENRWIASYALAMGRILATKSRIELYNQILAEAKTGLKKEDKKTNSWILYHDTNFSTKNSQIVKTYQKAMFYLNFVVDKYPNTPWAYIADKELTTPFGYKWVENYIEPPKMGGGGNNNPNPPKDDTIKKLQPKPQRKIEKI
jgi:hypothetical protein